MPRGRREARRHRQRDIDRRHGECAGRRQFRALVLDRVQVLTTTDFNGLGGTTFASVTTNLAFLTPSLSYTANDVSLTLATAAGGTGDPGGGGTTGGGTASTGFGFASVAQTRNQAAVATALDRGPVSNPLIIAVLNQTVAGARQAFDALSGEVFGSVHNAQGQEAQFARSAMLGRMRQSSYAGIPGDLGALGFGGPALAYAAGDTSSADSASAAYATKAAPGARGPSRDLTFWAQGLGGWGHADSDGNAASLRSRFGGFLSGVDARFGETWRAGFVAGYMRSDLNVDARASSAGIDSVQLGPYAAGRLGAFNVRGGGSYSLDSIDTSRAIVFPAFTDQTKARFHGNVGQIFGEVGYGMAPLSPGWLTCTCAMVRSSRAVALQRSRVQAPMRTPAIPSSACVRPPQCHWPTARCWSRAARCSGSTPSATRPRLLPWRSRARGRRSRLPASRSRATPRWWKAASTGALPRRPSSVRSIRANSPRTRRPTRSRAPSPGISDRRPASFRRAGEFKRMNLSPVMRP